MKLSTNPAHVPVTREQAKKLALAALFERCEQTDGRGFLRSADIAGHIWPRHKMTPQGAGASASRVLSLLKKEGLAEWGHTHRDGWGWKLTYQGRKQCRTNQQT